MQNDLDNQGKYNMKAVSTMVGILPGTLRAWERRYQMIAPVRNEAGHRLYSDNHVRKLKWLTQKVNDGFTISQAISLLEQEQKVSARPFNDQAEDRVSQLQQDILHAFLQFDERTVQDLMNEAFTIYTMDKVLIDILAPLLLQIGNMWEDGKITTAHEHFSTSILRSRIGAVMHAYPHNGILPKVVAVCAPGEWHELGLLIFTLYMRRKGYEVIYLGSSIKEHDIEVVLETVKPRFLFMSCTMTNNLSSTLELTLSLEKEFSNLVVGLGGSAIDSMNDEDKQKFHPNILGQSMNEWDHWIEEKTYAN
ncbi:MerR family transcriptional regulator [Paenisporosarcina quisquiliarum]|uniref:MerR family transcriptional regulator n=1 Tax=Paenisporosarcina quisquiliarum TaxID=365346 RepID=A0A9X3RCU5_9BACL|nr:B12-binding domain-containing protein [Paenisporosarcina quisquiliarum]MCZ8535758.1 MerR family transcriptional regulator [Paenisporosarcina quisquiliarum]